MSASSSQVAWASLRPSNSGAGKPNQVVSYHGEFIDTHPPGNIQPGAGPAGDQNPVQLHYFIRKKLPAMPSDAAPSRDGHGIGPGNVNVRGVCARKETRVLQQPEGRGVEGRRRPYCPLPARGYRDWA
jgi:hypothetical protein